MNASKWLQIETARQKTAAIADVVETLLRSSAVESTSAVALASSLEPSLKGSLQVSQQVSLPEYPGRDVEVILEIRSHPPKPPFNTPAGQARMLHDLGNIELQAMELAVRTLAQFPDAPGEFRRELADVALEEARHFNLCLDALDELGAPWGSWPVHRSLWDVVTDGDLLERVLVVHRYMEGAGLDAGSRLMTRLSGVHAPLARDVVGTIVREEVGHVAFGSKWYRRICADRRIDADVHFRIAYPEILRAIPRNEKPDYEARRLAGFNEPEIEVIKAALENTDFTKHRDGPKPNLAEILARLLEVPSSQV